MRCFNIVSITIAIFLYFNYILVSNLIESIKIENEKNNEKINEYIKNFPELSNNYTLNATIVKMSYILNTETQEYTGEVIMKYNNTFDNHNYCKIIVIHPEVHITEEYIITNYMNYNYKLGNNNTNIYCNKEQCVYRLYYDYDKKYEPFYCTILKNGIMIDEF
jgi:hypothetical protein